MIKEVFLSVVTADCVPLLIYDPEKLDLLQFMPVESWLIEIIKTAISSLIAKV